MKNIFLSGILLTVLGWLTLLFGSYVSVENRDIINLHMISIAQMMITTGLCITTIGAIRLAVERVVCALAFIPEIGKGLASSAEPTKGNAEGIAISNKSSPSAAELRQSLDALKNRN